MINTVRVLLLSLIVTIPGVVKAQVLSNVLGGILGGGGGQDILLLGAPTDESVETLLDQQDSIIDSISTGEESVIEFLQNTASATGTNPEVLTIILPGLDERVINTPSVENLGGDNSTARNVDESSEALCLQGGQKRGVGNYCESSAANSLLLYEGHFRSESAILTVASKEILRKFAAKIKDPASSHAEVNIYLAESIGAAKRLSLWQKRSRNVAAYFDRAGFATSTIMDLPTQQLAESNAEQRALSQAISRLHVVVIRNDKKA